MVVSRRYHFMNMKKEWCFSEEDAIYYIEYNTIRAIDYMDENYRPLIIRTSINIGDLL